MNLLSLTELMTDIGTALLALFNFSSEWEYSPRSEGMRHIPTGILIAPSMEHRVVVVAREEARHSILSDEDHRALWLRVQPLVVRCKGLENAAHRAVLVELLKLDNSS